MGKQRQATFGKLSLLEAKDVIAILSIELKRKRYL